MNISRRSFLAGAAASGREIRQDFEICNGAEGRLGGELAASRSGKKRNEKKRGKIGVNKRRKTLDAVSNEARRAFFIACGKRTTLK